MIDNIIYAIVSDTGLFLLFGISTLVIILTLGGGAIYYSHYAEDDMDEDIDIDSFLPPLTLTETVQSPIDENISYIKNQYGDPENKYSLFEIQIAVAGIIVREKENWHPSLTESEKSRISDIFEKDYNLINQPIEIEDPPLPSTDDIVRKLQTLNPKEDL